jgi:hypothetical protein
MFYRNRITGYSFPEVDAADAQIADVWLMYNGKAEGIFNIHGGPDVPGPIYSSPFDGEDHKIIGYTQKPTIPGHVDYYWSVYVLSA